MLQPQVQQLPPQLVVGDLRQDHAGAPAAIQASRQPLREGAMLLDPRMAQPPEDPGVEQQLLRSLHGTGWDLPSASVRAQATFPHRIRYRRPSTPAAERPPSGSAPSARPAAADRPTASALPPAIWSPASALSRSTAYSSSLSSSPASSSPSSLGSHESKITLRLIGFS